MSQTTAYLCGYLFTVIAAGFSVVAGGFFAYGYFVEQDESQKGNQALLGGQKEQGDRVLGGVGEAKGEILDLQKEGTNQVTEGIDKSKVEVLRGLSKNENAIIESGKSNTDELSTKMDETEAKILAAIEANEKSLREELDERYQLGYVIFGGREAGEWKTFIKSNVRVDTDWSNVHVTKLDGDLIRFNVPKFDVYQNDDSLFDISNMGLNIPFKSGTIQNIARVGKWYSNLEVIDANPQMPIYAIGFGFQRPTAP